MRVWEGRRRRGWLHLGLYTLNEFQTQMSSLLDFDKLDLASTPNTLPADLNRPPPAALSPIPTAQLARVIQGVHTELLVQVFGDRIFVVITQLGRIGALVSQHHWVDCDSAELEGWIEPAGWVGKVSPLDSFATTKARSAVVVHPVQATHHSYIHNVVDAHTLTIAFRSKSTPHLPQSPPPSPQPRPLSSPPYPLFTPPPPSSPSLARPPHPTPLSSTTSTPTRPRPSAGRPQMKGTPAGRCCWGSHSSGGWGRRMRMERRG